MTRLVPPISLFSAISIAILIVGLTACDSATVIEEQPERPPVLELKVNDANDRVSLTIAGPRGLRGLQGTLLFDGLTVSAIEPGANTERIDRLFHSKLPGDSKGQLIVGITDTRQVLLPARGALLSISINKSAKRATLRLESVIAAQDDGASLVLESARLELK